MGDVPAHIQKKHILEIIIDPEHGNRKEVPSSDFERSKRKLREDGHYKCFVCGSDDNLQVHHFIVEWSEQNLADFSEVKLVAEILDIYGYAAQMKNEPIKNADDVRNMMVLCQEHHTGVDHKDDNSGTGIHSTTFPVWIMQRVAKKGENPVPQKGETYEDALKRVEEVEDASCNPN